MIDARSTTYVRRRFGRGRIAAAARLTAGFALAASLAMPLSAVAQSDPALPMSFAGLSLQQAETAGIAASPDVAAARARLEGARAALSATAFGALPSGFGSFTEAPQSAAPLPGTIAAHQTTFGVQANLNDLLFGFAPAVRQAAASVRSAQADESAAERTERIAAARAYFAALKAAAVMTARADALALAQSEQRAAQTRFRSGDVGRVDVVRAEVAVARASADFENARADDANARDALRVETGASDADLAATAPGALPTIPALAQDPAAASAAALRLRPEVAAAQNAVDASIGALHAAYAGVVGPITVSSGFATGVDSGQRVAGSAVSAQVTVPLPLSSAARVSQAQAGVSEAKAHLAAIQRRVALETAAAARTLVAADRAAAATQRARDAARQALDAIELGYRSGASSGLDVFQARSTYVQAQVDELSAFYDEATAAAVFDVEAGR